MVKENHLTKKDILQKITSVAIFKLIILAVLKNSCFGIFVLKTHLSYFILSILYVKTCEPFDKREDFFNTPVLLLDQFKI